ncbi:hypothetical protein [Jannaschia sp. 2305UL9-9]
MCRQIGQTRKMHHPRTIRPRNGRQARRDVQAHHATATDTGLVDQATG